MSFTPLPTPTIETERLILRPWREDDFDVLREIFANEATARYMGGTKPDWQTWRHMALIYGHWHLRGYTVFVAERKTDGAAIGYAGPWFPHGWPEPEIGYALLGPAHGQGYATEAAAAGLRFAYEELGWHTAISLIHVDNAGSKAVAKRMGAHFEETATLLGDVQGEIWRHAPPGPRSA